MNVNVLFFRLFNMSVTASWLVLAIIVLRLIFKKAPKAMWCLLWGMVALRLVCPFSFESTLSLIPSTETMPENVLYSNSPILQPDSPVQNLSVDPGSHVPPAPIDVEHSPAQSWISTFSMVWLVGMVGMLFYTLNSYFKIHRQVAEAVEWKKPVYGCDHIQSPFILGIFRPRIYVPSDLSQEDLPYVLAHEKAHLKRKDHWWKPLGFLLLSIYWFNPVMWIAYILMCRDIELACDEKVVQKLGINRKKSYSNSLINCSVSRKSIAACPLAFGEVDVKRRVKSIMKYKKPAIGVLLIAVILCTVLAVCFLSNPKTMHLTDLNDTDIQQISCIKVTNGRKSYQISEKKFVETVEDFLKNVEITPNKGSQSRDEIPKKANSLAVCNNGDEFHVMCFSTDFQTVWVDNGEKAVATYAVKNPAQLNDFLENQVENLATEIPYMFSINDWDLTAVDNIILHNLHNDKITEITDAGQVSEILSYVGQLNGRFPESVPENSEGTYSLHFCSGEKAVLNISFGDVNDIYAEADTLSYFRYLYNWPTSRDVIKFLSGYDKSGDPIVNDYFEEAENLGLQLVLDEQTPNGVLAKLYRDESQKSDASFKLSGFTLEKKQGDHWNTIKADSGSSSENIPGTEDAQSLFWMDALAAGQYRVTMDVYINAPGKIFQTVLVQGEFKIS